MKRSLMFLCALLLITCACSKKWQPPENPDPSEIRSEVLQDVFAQRYQEAHAKCLWYYQNARKLDPSLSETRRSDILSDWHLLAEQYPPALATLQEVSADLENKFKEGKEIEESFIELARLNNLFEQEFKTKEMFQKLDSTDSETAKKVSIFAERALLITKEYELCLKYINPERKITLIVEMFRLNKERIKDEKDPRQAASIHELTYKSFAYRVASLVALLVVNDRKAEAGKIAGQAKAEWNDPMFHAKIDAALKGNFPPPWP